MIKTDRQLRAYGDNEDWCEGTYGVGTPNYEKCVTPGIFAPWTIVGKAERGLPQTDPYALTAKAAGQAVKETFAPERAPEATQAGRVTTKMIDTGAKVVLYGSLALLAGAIILKTRRSRRGRYRRAA